MFDQLLRRWENQIKPVNVRPVEPPAPEREDEAYLAWGKGMSGSYDVAPFISFRVEEREVSRVTSVKRVENPEDASQYVDVEVIDELITRTAGGELRKLILNNENED